MREEFLEQGTKTLESRTGISGHTQSTDGLATEKSGTVWFGTLQWSGSWKMTVEQALNSQVRVSGGYNDFDFALELAPGESHSTPVFTAGFTPVVSGKPPGCCISTEKALYPENMCDVESRLQHVRCWRGAEWHVA